MGKVDPKWPQMAQKMSARCPKTGPDGQKRASEQTARVRMARNELQSRPQSPKHYVYAIPRDYVYAIPGGVFRTNI